MQSTPEFMPDDVAVAEEVIGGCLEGAETSGYYGYAALVEGAVAGYICFGPVPLTSGAWDLYWLAVDVSRRGQGIGAALTGAAEAEITRQSGYLALVETSSRADYDTARHFYERQGYEVAARILDFYAPGEHKLIYQRRLNRVTPRHYTVNRA